MEVKSRICCIVNVGWKYVRYRKRRPRSMEGGIVSAIT